MKPIGASPGWDLNCDLGEGEDASVTTALFDCIGSANVACGVHAGDAASMARCARLSVGKGVRLGAHPGTAAGFGRLETALTAVQLGDLVEAQLAVFLRCVTAEGARVHHVKLHGSLYHLSDATPEHAIAYLRAVRRVDPTLRVYARASGRVARIAATEGVEAWPEVFVDRGYLPDGRLVPRGEPGDVLSVAAALERLETLVTTGCWMAVDGSRLSAAGRTLCLHGDGAEVVTLARSAAAILRRAPGFGRESGSDSCRG